MREHQVIGEKMDRYDVLVNPCKEKPLSNVRENFKDVKVAINTSPKNIDESLIWIDRTEIVELTRLAVEKL